MSSNTNTLFWVITGAVIVLAIFTLLTGLKDDSLPRIFNTIDSKWSSQNKNNNNEDGYDIGSNKFYCGSNQKSKDGIKLYVKKVINKPNSETEIEWTLTNIGNEVINKKALNFYLYDCDTNEKLVDAIWYLDNYQPNEVIELWTGANVTPGDWSFYIDFELSDDYYHGEY